MMRRVTTAEPCATSRLVSSILVARAEQQLSNDPSSIYQTPQRSFSKGSFIHLAPPSPSTPHQTSPGSHQQSPCPSIDEMLDSAAEELPSAAVLNPEPLWQLEFGSCWQRMSNTPAAITSNPRDLVLDIEESSFSVSSSSDAEAAAAAATSANSSSRKLKKRAMSLDIVGSKRRQAAAAAALKLAPARSETRSPAGPYIPDWEILMLAETMDKEVLDDVEDEDEFVGAYREEPLPVRQSPVAPAATRRRRSLRSSSSVDPQTMSSAKSKKMIEKWYWSYPPPNQDETTPTDGENNK